MDLDLPKMLSEFLLFLRGNILVSEEYHRSFGDEKGQFVFLLVRQVFELKTYNLGSDVGSQGDDLFRGPEQCALGLVRSSSCVDVFTVDIPDVDGIVEEEGLCWPLGISVAEINSRFLETGAGRGGQGESILFLDDKILDSRIDWEDFCCRGCHVPFVCFGL